MVVVSGQVVQMIGKGEVKDYIWRGDYPKNLNFVVIECNIGKGFFKKFWDRARNRDFYNVFVDDEFFKNRNEGDYVVIDIKKFELTDFCVLNNEGG